MSFLRLLKNIVVVGVIQCLDTITKYGGKLAIVTYFGLLGYLVYLYYSITGKYHTFTEFQMIDLLSLLVYTLFLVILISYIYTFLIGPGVGTIPEHYIEDIRENNEVIDEILEKTKSEPELRGKAWCSICCAWRYEGTHHCRYVLQFYAHHIPVFFCVTHHKYQRFRHSHDSLLCISCIFLALQNL